MTALETTGYWLILGRTADYGEVLLWRGLERSCALNRLRCLREQIRVGMERGIQAVRLVPEYVREEPQP